MVHKPWGSKGGKYGSGRTAIPSGNSTHKRYGGKKKRPDWKIGWDAYKRSSQGKRDLKRT